MSNVQPRTSVGFWDFYRDVFSSEHRNPINIALHIAGVFLSAALFPLSIWTDNLWLVLLYPIVHAAPGVLGHRLLERNVVVGDIRLTRRDFPIWWFIIANHVLAFDVLFGGLRWLPTMLFLGSLCLGLGAIEHADSERTFLSNFYVAFVSAMEFGLSKLR